jgi:hypothetical protein
LEWWWVSEREGKGERSGWRVRVANLIPRHHPQWLQFGSYLREREGG